ncbi:MAG: hypothetical protein ACREK4_13470 [Candidatus Rokuibacteriota bacterium]
MKRPTIIAGVLAYDEHPDTIAAALATVAALDDAIVFGESGSIESERGEAAARQAGLEWARIAGADWYLQLDADERLVHGELLHDLLAEHHPRAYPLPYVSERGWITLAPFKLFRAKGARIELGSDVISWDGEEPWLLSGFAFPPELRHVVRAMPHLLHLPSERPDAATRRRLSERIEGSDLARILTRKWPLPFPVPRARPAA